MGLFNEKDEQTLYKPSASPTSGGRAEATGEIPRVQAPSAVAIDDDEERISLGEIVRFAINSAGRRKLLSAFILLLGGGLTATAVTYAPRTYQSVGEVLVVSPSEENQGWNTDNKRQQLEWEKQVRSRETIEGIVRDAQLVENWDDMRQPHRKLLDQLRAKMGERPFTAEQKFGAVVGMLEGMLKLYIDQSTVSILCEWSDPEAARDIVQSALSRFIDKRYQTEVGIILTRIKPLEDQLESARLVLERIDPSLAPAKEAPTEATPAEKLVSVERSREAIEAGKKLQAARERQSAAAAKLGELESQRQQKVSRLQAEIQEKGGRLGPAHPEMMYLKLQLQSAQKETSEIIAARAAKERADAEVAEYAGIAGVPIRTSRPSTMAAPQKKFDELTLQKIASARDEYNRKKDALDAENLRLRVAEAEFKSKYQITRPPEVPMAPKKPVGLMVGLGGGFATLLAILALAALRDRSAGIFFEAKHVRDRLKLPVLGDIRAADIAN